MNKPKTNIPETNLEKTGLKETESNLRLHPKMPDIFNGPIAPTTIMLSLPIMLSQLLTFAYTIVDTIFIAMIDKQSTALLSGTGLVFPLYFLFITIATGLSTGISSLVARGIGEKNTVVINRTADSGLLLALGLSICTIIGGGFAGKGLLNLFAGSSLSAEAIGYGIDYFYYLLPGMGILLLSYTFGGILQGEGLMKYIGRAMLMTTVLNIILDPVLIFGFNMGVKGAALATSIAIGLTVFYFILLFARKKTIIPIKWNLFNADKKLIKEILRIGVPASLGMFSISIGFIVLNNIVSSISQDAMNSWVLVGRTDQLLLIPAFAIAGTTIAMIGQNYGRGNLARVRNIFKVNLLICIVICGFFSLIYILSSPFVFKLFSYVPGVIAGSVRQVRFLAFTLIGISGAIIVSSSFQATGRPLPDLIIVLIRMGIISIPLTLLSVYVFKLGMTGVFISLGAGNILSFIIALPWGKRHIKNLKVHIPFPVENAPGNKVKKEIMM